MVHWLQRMKHPSFINIKAGGLQYSQPSGVLRCAKCVLRCDWLVKLLFLKIWPLKWWSTWKLWGIMLVCRAWNGGYILRHRAFGWCTRMNMMCFCIVRKLWRAFPWSLRGTLLIGKKKTVEQRKCLWGNKIWQWQTNIACIDRRYPINLVHWSIADQRYQHQSPEAC